MFTKNMKLSYLLDFYGELLDEHTREIMTAYYNDDLSLAEIAADDGISRQGVRHIVKKGEDELTRYESTLHMAERHTELTACAEKLAHAAEVLSLLNVKETDGCISAIRDAVAVILGKGV